MSDDDVIKLAGKHCIWAWKLWDSSQSGKTARDLVLEFARALIKNAGDSGKWQPIETAPKDGSILLATANSPVPIYCGRRRLGQLGEPQQDEFRWRCNSSGRFGSPTHWMPLLKAPT